MILRHRAALNGVQLETLDPRILVTGISELAPSMNVNTTPRWGMGTNLTKNVPASLDVQVKFSIRIKKQDQAGRAEVFSMVNGWAAGGGYLTVSHREGKRIRVSCNGITAFDDPVKWTTEYTITFRAYEAPYWEDAREWSDTFTGSSIAARVIARGNLPTVADMYIRNDGSSSISSLTITANGKTMAFSSLSLAAGHTLAIEHDEHGFLTIKDGSTSKMSARTLSSVDDIELVPGPNEITVSSSRQMTVEVRHRGRWY